MCCTWSLSAALTTRVTALPSSGFLYLLRQRNAATQSCQTRPEMHKLPPLLLRVLLPCTGRALRRGEFFTIRSYYSLVKALHSVRASDNARQGHNRDRCHRQTYIWLVTHSQLSTQRHEDLTVLASSRGQVDTASQQPSKQVSRFAARLLSGCDLGGLHGRHDGSRS